jgi:hypothetical protein
MKAHIAASLARAKVPQHRDGPRPPCCNDRERSLHFILPNSTFWQKSGGPYKSSLHFFIRPRLDFGHFFQALV